MYTGPLYDTNHVPIEPGVKPASTSAWFADHIHDFQLTFISPRNALPTGAFWC